MSSKRVVIAVTVTLLLAGCVGSGGNGGGGSLVSQSSDGADLTAGEADAGGGDSGDGGSGAADAGSVQIDAAAQQRAIIRTGRMVVEVANFSESVAAVTAAARDRDGYVSDSNQRLHRTGDATWRTGYVEVRIPSGDYEAMQAAVGEQGTIVTEETSTTEVTDELVDLEARIENLEQRRDRLRTFYGRANDTEELLQIEEELAEVQGQIERLEAQRRSLEQRVAFSTLRVELREPSPTSNEIRTQYHEQSLVAVFLGSVSDVYVFARASLVTLAGALPWLVVLALPAVGLRRALRGRSLPRIRSGVDQSEPVKDEPETDPEDRSDGDTSENEPPSASGGESTEETAGSEPGDGR